MFVCRVLAFIELSWGVGEEPNGSLTLVKTVSTRDPELRT